MSPLTELAAAFPPSLGYRGACTTIADLSRICWGVDRALKRASVSLIVAANMAAYEAMGSGAAANRRALAVALARDEAVRAYIRGETNVNPLTGEDERLQDEIEVLEEMYRDEERRALSAAEVDKLAEEQGEARVRRSYHDLPLGRPGNE
jgi:hypothetical protein